MIKVSLFFVAFLSLFSGCNDGGMGSAASNSSLSTENLSSAEVSEAPADSVLLGNANAAANSAAKPGGGGGRQNGQVIKQNISLAQTSAATINTAPTDRKIIRNAELNLEAEDPELAQREITSVAELRGGFVVESQQSGSDIKAAQRDIVTMTVRVPADRFSETLSDIRATSTRVVLETIKGQDVTEEFIDIEAQLKARKALEVQFMEIMKRAYNVGDALMVQGQLADVRGEIERIEGRKRFLENQSSLSTIKIRLQTAKVIAAASTTNFNGRLAESFGAGADVALSFVLGLVTFIVAVLPFALFVGLPAFIIVRYFWKRQSRPKSVSEIAEEEIQGT
jgi:hypothetical protein